MIKPDQAVIKYPNLSGGQEYCLIEIVTTHMFIEKNGVGRMKRRMRELRIAEEQPERGELIWLINSLKCDFISEDKSIAAYCLPGTSFRRMWKAIPESMRMFNISGT